MTNQVPQIETWTPLYPIDTSDECRELFTRQAFLQFGLPTFSVTTHSRLITPQMGRIYLTDYVLLPWEDRIIDQATLFHEVVKRYPECPGSSLPTPNVQPLVLVEVYDDVSSDDAPYMLLQGYTFLFWAEFLPNIHELATAYLQAWINDNDVYAMISRQIEAIRGNGPT